MSFERTRRHRIRWFSWALRMRRPFASAVHSWGLLTGIMHTQLTLWSLRKSWKCFFLWLLVNLFWKILRSSTRSDSAVVLWIRSLIHVKGGYFSLFMEFFVVKRSRGPLSQFWFTFLFLKGCLLRCFALWCVEWHVSLINEFPARVALGFC